MRLYVGQQMIATVDVVRMSADVPVAPNAGRIQQVHELLQTKVNQAYAPKLAAAVLSFFNEPTRYAFMDAGRVSTVIARALCTDRYLNCA